MKLGLCVVINTVSFPEIKKKQKKTFSGGNAARRHWACNDLLMERLAFLDREAEREPVVRGRTEETEVEEDKWRQRWGQVSLAGITL